MGRSQVRKISLKGSSLHQNAVEAVDFASVAVGALFRWLLSQMRLMLQPQLHDYDQAACVMEAPEGFF
eukprot:4504462-Amphidinium_carterae.1